MKISVQNLGPIKEGTIDLSKNLTVFCGPNGTGKTFIAKLVHYCFEETKHTLDWFINYDEKIKLLIKQINQKAREGGSLEIEINNELNRIREKTINQINSLENIHISYNLSESQKEIFKKDLKITIEKENYFDSFYQNEIKEKDVEILNGEQYKLIISKEVSSNNLTIKFPSVNKDIDFVSNLLDSNSDFLFIELFLQLIWNFKFNILFLQDNRAAEVNFSTFMKNKLYYIKYFVTDELLEIKQNNLFFNNSNFKGHYYDLVLELEVALIGGSLFYTESGEIMFKINRTNEDFAFNLLSSSIKSLSIFILYLKHIVKKNETIIIDEPEMNLHPDTQVMFARIIARLINAGLKFIISTHSDFILREFNTLIEIGLHEKTKSFAINEFKYKSDEFINKNDINIFYFYFKEGEIKSSIKQLEMDEFGFSVDSIDQVIDNNNIKFEDLNALLNQIKRHEHNNLNIVDFNNEKNIKITQVAEDEEKFN